MAAWWRQVAVVAVVAVVATALQPQHMVVGDSLVAAHGNLTSHSRVRRIVFLTSERRLTFPPETIVVLTPTLSLPVARNLPLGYAASMTISIPFEIIFDDLGLTSAENPYGLWPALLRRKREALDWWPGVNWAGGDRALMYQIVEDTLGNMGMNGTACLLRSICEVFQQPLLHHGFLGEVLQLFLSPSRSPFADLRLGEYTRAERRGRSSGECDEYHAGCPKSLFTNPGRTAWMDGEGRECSDAPGVPS